MRLFEAIVDANHRASAGDKTAGIHPADFADSLPVAALTCIDVRLNPLLPEVLGIPESEFIWLRNAGNIITSSTSSTMRSLALACVVKGGREIAIIGHTDCKVRQMTILELTERFRALGIERSRLPDNLTEYFGVFASERQNVIKAVDFTRNSPLISPKIPVHGLLVDVQTGLLEWIVNGYQSFATSTAPGAAGTKPEELRLAALPSLAGFSVGEIKMPEGKIGAERVDADKWEREVTIVSAPTPEARPKLKMEKGPPIPLPPPIHPVSKLRQPWKKKPGA
jgi:carbonic anhydrase